MSNFHETVFVGGGISCLAAARRFRGDSILIEQSDRVGGLCKTDLVEGFRFDRTGHLLHLRNPEVVRLVKGLLRGNLGKRVRNSWVYSHDVFTRYPFQSHFFGLPPDVVIECLMGVIHASRKRRTSKTRNFAKWVLDRFGPGVARHFMFPYNQKLWTVSPRVLTTEWLGRFVPRPDLEQVVRGAISDLPDRAGYNASFHYPIRGGIEALVLALARGVKKIECGVGVKHIDLGERRLGLTTGDEIHFGRLVTCVPLPELVRMLHAIPDRIKEAARKLRWSSVYNLNLGLRAPASDKHWVYVPESRFAMYRFGYASNFSDNLAPRGMRNVYTEVAYDRRRPPDKKAIKGRLLHDLKRIGVIESQKDILVTHAFDLPHAYAIYDKHRTRSVKTLLNFLESREIYPVGRYGRWEYGAMEDAIAQGLDLADKQL